jgi:hypothetical protein
MATPERKANKVRLERLIAEIIFEARPDLMDKWLGYEERRTAYDKWVKDRDHLSFLRECKVFLDNPSIPERIKEIIRDEFIGKMFRDPNYFYTEQARGMALSMITNLEWPLLPAPESP